MKIGNYEYLIDENMVLSQQNPDPFEYNENYISCYDDEKYKQATKQLMDIRCTLIREHLYCRGFELLDYGAGRGHFLDHLNQTLSFRKSYYYEPSGGFLFKETFPEWGGEPVDVITLWDVLEHIPNIYKFVEDHKFRYYVVSVPNRPRLVELETWKHLKPNEHLHHFDEESLVKFFKHHGYKKVFTGFPEDQVRKGAKNILTGIFRLW